MGFKKNFEIKVFPFMSGIQISSTNQNQMTSTHS